MGQPGTDSAKSPATLAPISGGWHCSHLYYLFDRARLLKLSADEIKAGREEFVAVLDSKSSNAPLRLQSAIVSGHKADFSLMLLDPDPLKIDRVHQRLMASRLGPVLRPGYSFVSMTEISEYVLSVEQYSQRIVAEGEKAGSPSYEAKVKTYGERLEVMNRQRLTPEFPPYRATCFYPMNKRRDAGQNWFALSKSERDKLMVEHARSGIAFAGKVTQLITVGIGLDDWEWGVTLWADNPEYLKQIVYRMRFDEASAKYAEFGQFLVSYVASAKEILDHCLIGT